MQSSDEVWSSRRLGTQCSLFPWWKMWVDYTRCLHSPSPLPSHKLAVVMREIGWYDVLFILVDLVSGSSDHSVAIVDLANTQLVHMDEKSHEYVHSSPSLPHSFLAALLVLMVKPFLSSKAVPSIAWLCMTITCWRVVMMMMEQWRSPIRILNKELAKMSRILTISFVFVLDLGHPRSIQSGQQVLHERERRLHFRHLCGRETEHAHLHEVWNRSSYSWSILDANLTCFLSVLIAFQWWWAFGCVWHEERCFGGALGQLGRRAFVLCIDQGKHQVFHIWKAGKNPFVLMCVVL